jgi:hypothetical protein
MENSMSVDDFIAISDKIKEFGIDAYEALDNEEKHNLVRRFASEIRVEKAPEN